jgi:hypothetical protein
MIADSYFCVSGAADKRYSLAERKNMDNIEQFSLYTAKVFEELYDSFPVPVSINRHKMISTCLLFNKDEELKKLKLKEVFSNLLVELKPNGKEQELEEKLPLIKQMRSDLEHEKNSEISIQTTLFNSTLDFLISEGLVRIPESGGYVLTAKAFSHLNKNFNNGALTNGDSSYIKAIKSIFSHTVDATEKISIGIAVKVIPQLLGIS